MRQIALNQIILLVSILHHLFVLLHTGTPVHFVVFNHLLNEVKSWQYLHHSLESWLDDDIDEAQLGLSHVGSLSVIEETHREIVLLLKVSLREELHE